MQTKGHLLGSFCIEACVRARAVLSGYVHLLPLQRTWAQFCTPTMNSFQPPVTPAPEDPMPSSHFPGHLHVHSTCKLTHINKCKTLRARWSWGLRPCEVQGQPGLHTETLSHKTKYQSEPWIWWHTHIILEGGVVWFWMVRNLGQGLSLPQSRAVVAHAFNPSTWEAETGRFLNSKSWSTEWVPGQPGLYRESV